MSRSDSLRVFSVAAFFGLVAGLLEAIVFLVIQLVPGAPSWDMMLEGVSIDFLWIAPIVNLLLFLMFAALLVTAGAVSRWIPLLGRVSALEIAVFACAALTCFVVLRVPDRLHGGAVLLLALGMAVQIWRRFRAAADARVKRLRSWLPWLVGLVAVMALVIRVSTATMEGWNLRRLPPALDGVPNVLMIVLDTVRADHLSAYGYDRQTTPTLDRFAGEGALFERAISTAPWTMASHASLFTGLQVHEHRADGSTPWLASTHPTLAEVLAANGFATAAFSANKFWVNRNSGVARGFAHIDDFFHSPADALIRTVLVKEIVGKFVRFGGSTYPFDRKRADYVTDSLIAWLDQAGGRPFFAFLNYIDAHTPYLSPEPYHSRFMTAAERERFQRVPVRPPPIVSDPAPAWRSASVAAYDGALAYLDTEVGRVLENLRARELLDRTFVVIVSDHGESFGEHGLYRHWNSLYMEQLHVPLLLRFPAAIPAGLRVRSPISTTDVPATILDVVGFEHSRLLPGASLARFWGLPLASVPYDAARILSQADRRHRVPPALPLSKGWLRSVIVGEWHLVEHESGRVELYRLSDDPGELTNLAETAENATVVADLRRELAQAAAGSAAIDNGR